MNTYLLYTNQLVYNVEKEILSEAVIYMSKQKV